MQPIDWSGIDELGQCPICAVGESADPSAKVSELQSLAQQAFRMFHRDVRVGETINL
jgi:hypothetical protein